MRRQTLGRRNAAPVQSTKLDPSSREQLSDIGTSVLYTIAIRFATLHRISMLIGTNEAIEERLARTGCARFTAVASDRGWVGDLHDDTSNQPGRYCDGQGQGPRASPVRDCVLRPGS